MTQSIFTSQTPSVTNASDGAPGLTLSTLFVTGVNGFITGIRWFFPATLPAGTVTGHLYQRTSDAAGILLGSATFVAPVAGTWNVAMFASAIPVTAAQDYYTSVWTPNRYVATANFFSAAGLTNGDLTAPQSAAGRRNGRFAAGATPTYPTTDVNDTCYFADVLFETAAVVAPDTLAMPLVVGEPTVSQDFTVTPDTLLMPMTVGEPTVSQPSPLGPDLVSGLAEALLTCLCDAVALLGTDAPQNCCLRVGYEIPYDMGLREDLCCQGLAYVALGPVYPSFDSFPEHDIVRQAESRCGIAAWAVEFRVGIIRCIPVGDENAGPSCIDWTTAALQAMADSQVLRRVSCCITARIAFEDDFLNGMMLGMSIVTGRQEQGQPQGGCVERYVTINMQIPNCDIC